MLETPKILLRSNRFHMDYLEGSLYNVVKNYCMVLMESMFVVWFCGGSVDGKICGYV